MLTFPQVRRGAAHASANHHPVESVSSALSPAEQLCCYWNRSSQVQVIRIEDVNAFFERVVFPGQRLLFEAPLAQMLKVYYGRVAVFQVNEIACCDLQVQFE